MEYGTTIVLKMYDQKRRPGKRRANEDQEPKSGKPKDGRYGKR